MDVWMCKREQGYSGGLAVVAAKSRDEAFRVYHSHIEHSWEYVEYNDDGYLYPKDSWFLCESLTANVNEPCVIAEDGYPE